MLRRDCCVRRASVIPTDRNMSATVTRQNKICNDRTFCSSDAYGNGSSPCVAYHVEIRLVEKRDKLNPTKPNRIAAHTRNGKGRYIKVGAVAGDGGSGPKTQMATRTVAIASTANSNHRAALISRIRNVFFAPRSTIGGTIVSTAHAFVKNLSSPRCQ